MNKGRKKIVRNEKKRNKNMWPLLNKRSKIFSYEIGVRKIWKISQMNRKIEIKGSEADRKKKKKFLFRRL